MTSVAQDTHPPGAPTAHSALHHQYQAHAAAIETRDGWLVPARFSCVDAEVQAAETAVAIAELFGVTTLELVGEALPEYAGLHGVADVPIGAAAHVKLPDTGEVRWLRLTPTHAHILCAGVQTAGRPSMRNELLERLNVRTLERPNACLHPTDLSSGLTTLVVIGPHSHDLLARLVRLDLDPRAFSDHSIALTGAAGIPLQLLRWDRGPLQTYELTVGRDVAEYWWETLMHAGDGLGLQPIGVEALARLGRGDGQSDA